MNAELLKLIQDNLDTRDKRFMFLKIIYPEFVHRVYLEGATLDFSVRLYLEFEKQNRLNELETYIKQYLV